MIRIRDQEVKEKFTEIHLRQRMYQEKSYVTLMIITEFYPTEMSQGIVSGSIEAKIDLEGISCLDDLEKKNLEGDIGSVTLSVNNNGIWEHQSEDQFQIQIIQRKGRELTFVLTTSEFVLDTYGELVSLYTTSTSRENLEEVFKMDDFYDKVVEKKVGNGTIVKYFVKE